MGQVIAQLRETSPLIIMVGLGLAFAAGLIGLSAVLLGEVTLTLIIGGIVLISGLKLLFTRPEFGIELLIATIFVVLLLSDYGEVQVAGFDAGLASLLKDALFLLVLIAWVWHFLSGNCRIRVDRLTLVIVAFMIWTVLRGITSPSGYVIGLLGVRMTIQYAFLFFVAGTTIRSQNHLRTLLWILVLSSLYPVATSIPQVSPAVSNIAGMGTGSIWWSEVRVYSPMATVYSANVFAGYISIVLASVLAFLLFDDRQLSKLARVFLIGYGVVLSMVLLLTFSRRAWFAFAIVILVYLILKRVSFQTVLIIAILAGSLVLLLPGSVIEVANVRVESMFVGQIEDILSPRRLEEWQYLWEGVSKSPELLLFGVGLGMAGAVGQGLDLASSVGGHNYYILTLYQLGILGLALFLAILAAGSAKSLRALSSRDPLIRQAVATALAAMIIVMASALAGISFENYPLNLLFWLFLGVVQACDQLSPCDEIGLQSADKGTSNGAEPVIETRPQKS